MVDNEGFSSLLEHDAPVYPHLEQWVKGAAADRRVELVRQKAELTGGDVLFLISCHEIISPEDRRNTERLLSFTRAIFRKGVAGPRIFGRYSRERIASSCP